MLIFILYTRRCRQAPTALPPFHSSLPNNYPHHYACSLLDSNRGFVGARLYTRRVAGVSDVWGSYQEAKSPKEIVVIDTNFASVETLSMDICDVTIDWNNFLWDFGFLLLFSYLNEKAWSVRKAELLKGSMNINDENDCNYKMKVVKERSHGNKLGKNFFWRSPYENDKSAFFVLL